MGQIHGKCDNGGFFCREDDELHRQCHLDMDTGTTTQFSATGVERAAKCPRQSEEKKANPGHRTAEPRTASRS